MNKARELEKKVLVRVLRRSRKEQIQHAVFLHYWPAFRSSFMNLGLLSPTEVRDVYAEAYARFRTDVTGRYKRTVSKRSMLSDLLLNGMIVCREKERNQRLVEIDDSSFSDSELLLKLLHFKDDLITAIIGESFRPSFAIVFALKRELQLNKQVLENLQLAYAPAYLKLLELIDRDKFKAPLTATVYTYFYQVYKRIQLEMYRLENQKFDNEKAGDEAFEEPEPVIQTGTDDVDWVLDKEPSLKRFDFGSSESLVAHLLNRLDEKCRSILTLYYLESVSLVDIELEMGISNAKMTAYRCRTKLQKLLKKERDGQT